MMHKTEEIEDIEEIIYYWKIRNCERCDCKFRCHINTEIDMGEYNDDLDFFDYDCEDFVNEADEYLRRQLEAREKEIENLECKYGINIKKIKNSTKSYSMI